MTTAAPIAQTFPKSARLRQRGDFVRVFDAGRRVAAPALALHALAAPRPRLGVAVSRKVDPNAVGRNRIKRVLRDATLRLRPQLAGGDYVVVARVAARTASNAQLVEAWHRLLQWAGALPHPGGTGTMPAIQSSQSPTSPSSTPTSTPDA